MSICVLDSDNSSFMEPLQQIINYPLVCIVYYGVF